MRLKKLEITGFKSFCEKSGINFPPGISAIVGPNGCGKSNIVDALRWAMGEQSVKQLRGKSMEDIIFAGTNGKPPLNMAEVSVTMANDNGTSPAELRDFTEIMLTRRLYRSGESAYFINKQPCRLKDIHNIFLGSGMGAKSYAVIQQGNIGAITDAGPEERRFFIEEAAGITRYKNRKKETLAKLDSTNQNLLRLMDIIKEVERQMNSLKRQAKKAEHYKNYKARIKTLDIKISLEQYEECSQKIQENNYILKELKDKDIEHVSGLKKLDATVEEIRVRQIQKDQKISTYKSDKFELQRKIDRIENELSHLKKEAKRLETESLTLQEGCDTLQARTQEIQTEIIEIENRIKSLNIETGLLQAELSKEQEDSQSARDKLASLNRELKDAENQLMELAALESKYQNIKQNVSNNKDNLKRRLKQIDEEVLLAGKNLTILQKKEKESAEELELCRQELQDSAQNINITRKQLSENNQVLGQQVKTVQAIEYNKNKSRSQYSALKKMEDNFDWYKDGVKAVMKKEQENGRIMGLIADIIEPVPSYESAVEAILGEALQYILVKDIKTGAENIEYLQTQNTGRSGFIPLSSFNSIKPDIKSNIPNPLLDHIIIKPGFENIGNILLSHVSVVENMEDALEIHNQNKTLTLVTKNGDIISRRGIMIGGSQDKLSGIMLKKQELKKLEKFLLQIDQELEAAKQDQEKLEEQAGKLEYELQKNIEEKNQAAQDELEAQKTLYKITETIKHAAQNLDVLTMEQEQLASQADDMDEEMKKYNAAFLKVCDKIKTVQNKKALTENQISTFSKEIESFDRQVVNLKLKQRTLDAELENNTSTMKRLKDFQEDSLKRLKQLSADIKQKKEKKESAVNTISEHEQSLVLMYEQIQEIENILETQEADYAEIKLLLKQNDQSRSLIQNKREDILQKIRLIEIEQSKNKIKQDNISEQIEEKYHRPVSAFYLEFNSKTNNPEETQAQMKEELAELRQKLEKMGDVNMGAIAEYEQHKERFDFLETQRTDLVKAMEDLHKVINKINNISQERFLATFDLVNQKLAQVFPRLFNGGTASLVLTEPNNPLESGVEFMVHPPGKKLTRLTLLSGGEKALSAIAFVFSIFLIKPASFCILDEIDAPLDEANVYRFNELLKIIGEKSQIIMITHKKKSMEFADTLFGITMEQKGISKIVSVNLEGIDNYQQN
ncbi:Chromosome partition protein [Desulfonema limicola]|uniref:Chromosome partition protein Smc n=1 Tax=Desulfonema limicola TaxID=45656 RepID=A0A975GJG3_9BACT|nr:chromosome segregation protein SMC [Desulfonema limicola]QTA83397.1 Chromosome partition protein [Desulfonema limicola]